jgi:hypothetical protein
MLKIKLNAQPEDGKANKELIAYLAKVFEVRKMDVEITAGLTSREKTVEINQCAEKFELLLAQQMQLKQKL